MKQKDLPPLLRHLVRWLLPDGRAEDVLGDVQETHAWNIERIGQPAANRRLWREAAALLLWRVSSIGTASGGYKEQDHWRQNPKRYGGGGSMGRDFLQDFRLAVRMLARRPGFAATAILVLGLGIGAPTTVFTLVNQLFFVRPAEVIEPHRLVKLYATQAEQTGGAMQHPDFEYYRQAASTLDLAAYSEGGIDAPYSISPGEYDQLTPGFVSDNYFDVLGIRTILGREFLPEENAEPGTHAVLILSHPFWNRAFASDPDVVGRSILIADRPFTILGVMPEAFTGISVLETPPDVWLPIAMFGDIFADDSDGAWWEREPGRDYTWLQVVGRLATGATVEGAQSNLIALSDALEFEDRPEDSGVEVVRQFVQQRQAETLGNILRMLTAVVAIVTAIAAANVAVLLLSRASTRSREIGIRTAIGAGRSRLLRQLMAESLVIGLAGCAVGLIIAYTASDLAGSALPFPVHGDFTPDWTVVAGAAGLAVFLSCLVGLAPALHAARTDAGQAMRDTSPRRSGARTQSVLVISQIGLSLMLVAGAYLFGRSLWEARSQEVGFEVENRIALMVNLISLGYGPAEGQVFIRGAVDRVTAIPGVEGATAAYLVPFRGAMSSGFTAPEGATPTDAPDRINSGANYVGADYFDLMGIDIIEGRAIGANDLAGSEPVAVVNEAFARAVWPAESVLGKTLPFGDGGLTIVGVAETVTSYEIGEEPELMVYRALSQSFSPVFHLLVETATPAPELISAVQGAIREVEPSIAFGFVGTLESMLDDEVSRYQVAAVLVAVFGAIALVMAAVGLYGVVSFLVSQRTRDIGVRMTLGADRGRIASDVLREGLRLAGFGAIVGLAGAIAVRRFTESFLFGVEAGDPLPLVCAAFTLLAVTLLASLAPARRATRVDPMEAMRAE